MPIEVTSLWGIAALAALLPVLYHARRSLLQLPGWQRRLTLALRSFAILCLVAALCGLTWHYESRESQIAVAIDTSRSVSSAARAKAEGYVKRLGEGGHVAVLRFAMLPATQETGREPSAAPPTLTPGPSPTTVLGDTRRELSQESGALGTNIGVGLAAARALLPEGYVGRVVLLSDGNETAGDAAWVARQQGVPVDVVSLPAPKGEVYLIAAAAPPIRPGIGAEVEIQFESLGPNRGTVQLLDAGRLLAEKAVDAVAGQTTVRLPLRLDTPLGGPATVRLTGFADEVAENNELRLPLNAGPQPRVLVVEGQPAVGARLVEAWAKSLFDVAAVAAENTQPADTAKRDLIVLVNVPAPAFTPSTVEAIENHVRSGRGLVVVGGDRAFMPGGYRGSRLETLLPLAADAKEKQSSLAMVLVIDVSQSMEGKAIELARQATRQAVETLSPRDAVGILVFADEARWVSDIAPCTDKPAIQTRIDAIVAGGRTNMQPALRRAHLALRESFADRKHILLMSDGVSDPADFAATARAIAADDITISTVALGQEAAQAVLKQMAATGKGQFYYCPDETTLPKVFTTAAISASRPGIDDEPFRPQPTAAAADVLSGVPLDTLPPLMAFDETKTKPGATVLIMAGKGDALLALHRVDKGTVVAFTSSVDPNWANPWRRWPQFDAFWTQVARHALPPPNWSGTKAEADYPAELRLRPTNVELLKQVALQSGGRFDPQPADVLAEDGHTAPRRLPLWRYLVALAAVLWIGDICVRRLP